MIRQFPLLTFCSGLITKFNLTKLHHKNGNFLVLLHYLTPPTQIGYKSCCGNFSQPI